MANIRITKIFEFEMAHALTNYDGPCRQIHGHSYKLFVTLLGEPNSDKNSPKQGMVMDFGQLKQIVFKNIIEKFDHALVLHTSASDEIPANKAGLFEKTIFLNYQPTCENLVLDFTNILKKYLPDTVKLMQIKLFETNNSYAEWCAKDNE